MNDQREHPSSSLPLKYVRPGLSTYVTDVTDVTDVDSRVGRLGCVTQNTGSVPVCQKLNFCNRRDQLLFW